MLQVHASVAFEGKHSIAGRDRIRLLEAVGREGSISGAARAVGLSYKAAWDAIDGRRPSTSSHLKQIWKAR